jgi:glycine cleavage system H protein
MKKFTETHEWVDVEGKVATVGVSSSALREMGEVVYVALPKVGQVVAAGDPVAILESTKAATDIYSPVSGTVVAINESCLVHINAAPEGEGWLFRVEDK